MWELSDKHETAQEDFPFKTLSCFFTVKTLELILFRWARGEHTERNRKQRDEGSGTDSSL